MSVLTTLVSVILYVLGGGWLVLALGGLHLIEGLEGDWRVAFVIALVGLLHTADEFWPGLERPRRTFGPWLNELVSEERPGAWWRWPVNRREERRMAVGLCAVDALLAGAGLWWPLAWAVWAAFRGADLVMHLLGWAWMERGPGARTALFLTGPVALVLSPLIAYYVMNPGAAAVIALGASASPLTYWWARYRYLGAKEY